MITPDEHLDTALSKVKLYQTALGPEYTIRDIYYDDKGAPVNYRAGPA